MPCLLLDQWHKNLRVYFDTFDFKYCSQCFSIISFFSIYLQDAIRVSKIETVCLLLEGPLTHHRMQSARLNLPGKSTGRSSYRPSTATGRTICDTQGKGMVSKAHGGVEGLPLSLGWSQAALAGDSEAGSCSEVHLRHRSRVSARGGFALGEVGAAGTRNETEKKGGGRGGGVRKKEP